MMVLMGSLCVFQSGMLCMMLLLAKTFMGQVINNSNDTVLYYDMSMNLNLKNIFAAQFTLYIILV